MQIGTAHTPGAKVNYGCLNDAAGNWLQFYYTIVPGNPEPIANQWTHPSEHFPE